MERTRNIVVEKPRWKHTGGGFFVLRDHRIIKPGQIFQAFEYEIRPAFRDTIKLIEKLPEAERDLIIPAIKPVYSLRKRGGQWWDVIDANGKVINTKALKKEDAEEIIKSLKG